MKFLNAGISAVLVANVIFPSQGFAQVPSGNLIFPGGVVLPKTEEMKPSKDVAPIQEKPRIEEPKKPRIEEPNMKLEVPVLEQALQKLQKESCLIQKKTIFHSGGEQQVMYTYLSFEAEDGYIIKNPDGTNTLLTENQAKKLLSAGCLP
jgi:hypothetical protein